MAQTFADSIAVVETHMATATANLNFTVRGGEVLPPNRTAAWFYAGTGDNTLIGETLTDHPYEERIAVRFYWPIADRSMEPSRGIELETEAVTRAFIGLIEGDRSLGETCSATVISDADAGWLDNDNSWWRVVTVPLAIGYTDLEPISR